MIAVAIGFDPREAIAYHVCSNSIIRHASQPVAILPLALGNLRGHAETHTDGSNQFIYSRFLVPHLMEHSMTRLSARFRKYGTGFPTNSAPTPMPSCCTGRWARPASMNMPLPPWRRNGTARNSSPTSHCSG